MTKLRTTLFALPLAVLAACNATPEDGVAEGVLGSEDVFIIPDPADPCGATTVQFLVGRPESALNGRRYAAPLRILRTGDKIDKRDVNPNRLTVKISDTGRIASLTCS